MAKKISDNKQKPTLKQLLDYSKKLQELAIAHNEYWPGRHPDIPSKFSEELIKKLFNLDDGESKKIDAHYTIKNKTYNFEIKATGSSSGATSISKNAIKDKEFHFLIWAYFDLVKQTLEIKILKRSKIPKSDDQNNRQNIQLGKLLKSEKPLVEKFKLSSSQIENQVDACEQSLISILKKL